MRGQEREEEKEKKEDEGPLGFCPVAGMQGRDQEVADKSSRAQGQCRKEEGVN